MLCVGGGHQPRSDMDENTNRTTHSTRLISCGPSASTKTCGTPMRRSGPRQERWRPSFCAARSVSPAGTFGMGLANTVFGACEASDTGRRQDSAQSLLASGLLNVPM